jgi:hypothetical protein
MDPAEGFMIEQPSVARQSREIQGFRGGGSPPWAVHGPRLTDYGAPPAPLALSFTITTRNFAGLVWLAFSETMCTSSGPS